MTGPRRAAVVIALALVVALALGLGLTLDRPAPGPATPPPPLLAPAGPDAIAKPAPGDAVPQKARDVLAAIRAGGGDAPAGYVGGRSFANRERRLPRGRYREYDVDPRHPGQSRGAERLVIERESGRAYYTPDHYRTFVPVE
jgi:ribonuclease T1